MIEFTNLNEVGLLKRYSLGEREFNHIRIQKAQFRGAILRNISFRNSSLIDVDFRDADLGGADFRGCYFSRGNLAGAILNEVYLEETSLIKANLNYSQINHSYLRKANLQGAYLSQASLKNSILTEANLEGAHLNRANLSKARLKRANLSKAFLTGASLAQAIVTEVNLKDTLLSGVNFNGTYLNKSFYNEYTCFDKHFLPENAGMYKCKPITFQKLVIIFNYLIQRSKKYLGINLTMKYWESSRPNNCFCLNNFAIDVSGKITVNNHSHKQLVSEDCLQCSKQWINNFINRCSQIINNFSELIENKELEYIINTLEAKKSKIII